MNKKIISIIKNKYPKLFYFIARNYWIVFLINKFCYISYLFHKVTNKPYFGQSMMAAQTWETRKPYMRQLVECEISNKIKDTAGTYNILEIGSWAGDSTMLWASAIKKHPKINGIVVCVDPWEPYINHDDIEINVAPLIMDAALKSGKIFNLFLHNMFSTKNNDIVKPFKGTSDKLLPTLRDSFFDLVFVDGSHSFSNVIKDLNNVKRLVGDGGVVCGDDLELQKNEVDIENAENNKEKDVVFDTRSNKEFHPGVTLAVAEFFGREVTCFHGFWAMRKVGDGWEKVNIKLHSEREGADL